MRNLARLSVKILSALLCQALILTSAGLEAYAAVGRAAEVPAVHSMATPLVPASAFDLGRTMPGAAMGGLANIIGARLNAPAVVTATNAATETETQAAAAPAAAQGFKIQTDEGGAEIAPAAAFDEAGDRFKNGGAASQRVGTVVAATRSAFTPKPAPGSLDGSGYVPENVGQGKDQPGHLDANPSQAPPKTTGADVPAPQTGDKVAPSSSNDQKPSGDEGGLFGLGRAATWFIGALVVAQVGVEALGAAMPTLVQKSFGDFTIVANLAIFSSFASILGRQVGAMVVARYGLRKVYLGATALQLLAISALCGLLATGMMTVPLMMLFYSIKGFVGGIAATAENSIPPAILGSDQAKIEKFWTWEQTLLEIIGVSGPIITGMVVASFGFLPALIAFPIAFGAALAIMYFTLKIPEKVEAMRLTDLKNEEKLNLVKTSIGGLFKEFFAKIIFGAKLVWGNPVLRYTFLAFTAFTVLNPFLYNIIGPAYALRLVPDPQLATSVAGWLTGLYSLGGLLGGFIMMYEERRLTKAMGEAPVDEAALAAWQAKRAEFMRQSMLKWMMWATVGLSMIATFAFQSPLLFGTGITVSALALVFFGIAQVITVVKLKSAFQAKTPPQHMADAMSFFGSASLLVSTIGLFGLQFLFQNLAGFTPFYWIAGAMIPLAMIYLWLRSAVSNSSKPA